MSDSDSACIEVKNIDELIRKKQSEKTERDLLELLVFVSWNSRFGRMGCMSNRIPRTFQKRKRQRNPNPKLDNRRMSIFGLLSVEGSVRLVGVGGRVRYFPVQGMFLSIG